MISEPTPGLAVALGSSFLGAYCHAGFLSGLAASGIVPGKISGASAGAIAGSMFAAGLRGNDLSRAALDPAWRWSFVDTGMFLRLPGLFTGLWSSGLLSGKRAIAHFRHLFGEVDLSSLGSTKMEIAVTDVVNHRPKILRSGPLAELIVASCAVPGLIAIQHVGGSRYMDGGVACEVPFEHWLDDPAVGTIVVHRIRRVTGNKSARETLLSSFSSMHRTVCAEFHRHRTELVRRAGKRLIEVETATSVPGMFTGKNSRACYEAGVSAGERVAAHLRSL